MSTPEIHESISSAVEVFTTYENPLFFNDLPEALEYCTGNRKKYHRVQSALELSIKGQLSGRRGEEILELTIRGRTGVVPRAGGGRPGLTVSTNYEFERWFDLCLRVYEYDDPIFDRGIFWVSINDSQRAKLSFGLRPNHTSSVAELIERSSEGEKRAIKILTDAMNGIYPRQNIDS